MSEAYEFVKFDPKTTPVVEIFGQDHKSIAKLWNDGKVEIRVGVDVDEVAKRFWEAVSNRVRIDPIVNEAPPTEQARREAGTILATWDGFIYPDEREPLQKAIAADLAAKDDLIARYQVAIDTQLGEIKGLEKAITAKEAEIQRASMETCKYLAELEALRTELTTQTALLREAVTACKSVVSVWNAQCGRVFESMGSDNPRAQAIDDAIQNVSNLLSKPAIVEMAKEVGK